MKKMLMILFLISTTLLFARPKQVLKNDSAEPFEPLYPASRTEIILEEVDFEGDVSGWAAGGNWNLTTSDSHSPDHSFHSPDDNNTGEYSSYDLYSDVISLPNLGQDEIMHFKFWLNCDMPDVSQEDDPTTTDDESGFLADYYGISLKDLSAFSAWHTSAALNPIDGNNWWCADEEIGDNGGYLDSWVQFLDTPAFTVPANGQLTADMRWALESPAGAAISGSNVDGWDQANVQISEDGGFNWSIITGSDPYDFSCGYGMEWNGYECGAGWGGTSDWQNISFDLSQYSGQEVQIRFAFYSDAGFDTMSDPSLTGLQVDNISVSSGAFSDTADDPDALTGSGEIWVDQLYDYGDPTRPGGVGNGWTEYLPGYPFNGNAYLDISEYAGKDVIFRFQSRHDGNHYSELGLGDGSGQGAGLFIDDFIIYKESGGSYPPPQNLVATSGDESIALSWDDMNASGTSDYIYDNDQVTNSIVMSSEGATAWAGAEMNIAGPSVVNSVSIFNDSTFGNPLGTPIEIGAFGTIGSLYDNEPTYTANVTLDQEGWNTFEVDWSFNNNFIVAQKFSFEVNASLDESAVPSQHSKVLFAGGSWDDWSVAGATVGDGEWGIRANITKEGAGVTYNVYVDNVSTASGLTNNAFTVTGLENNTEYEFYATATYSDGEESGPSNTVSAIPFPQTVHEEAYDDDSFESTFNAGSGGYSAVKFDASNGGEDALFFKWFQTESGGAFYVKIWSDDNGPGEEVYSSITQGGASAGWHQKDLSASGISVSGAFWAGTKEFTSTRPFGVDTSSDDAGNSQSSASSTAPWEPIAGNLMYRMILDDVGGGGDCDGDITGDGSINVLDVVSLVNVIMGTANAGLCDDITGDGSVNVLDVVSLVNIIMGN